MYHDIFLNFVTLSQIDGGFSVSEIFLYFQNTQDSSYGAHTA